MASWEKGWRGRGGEKKTNLRCKKILNLNFEQHKYVVSWLFQAPPPPPRPKYDCLAPPRYVAAGNESETSEGFLNRISQFGRRTKVRRRDRTRRDEREMRRGERKSERVNERSEEKAAWASRSQTEPAGGETPRKNRAGFGVIGAREKKKPRGCGAREITRGGWGVLRQAISAGVATPHSPPPPSPPLSKLATPPGGVGHRPNLVWRDRVSASQTLTVPIM